MPTFKLGKAPARKGAIKLQLSDYTKKLPPPPAKGGHANLLTGTELGMLANDQYGDCVWAGAAHETMLWNKMAGRSPEFNNACVLGDYGAVTGFHVDDPQTDNGTDMQLAAKYRQDTGVIDAKGNRHKIVAYLAISDAADIRQAIHLFGAVGIGIKFPTFAMEQFNAGKPWILKPHAHIDGGHYIPGVNYDAEWVEIITWGKIQKASWGFIKKFMDEGVVYLTDEMLLNGKSLEGFDLAQLQADLAAIKSK